jgi:SAM-dependent methyltransferase
VPLRNLVNLGDARTLLRAVRSPRLRRTALNAMRPARRRAQGAWTMESAARVWANELPQIRAAQNRAITGDPEGSLQRWFLDRWFAGRSDLRMISIGSGAGWKELQWAQTGRFASIEAFDISPQYVAVANASAADHGFADVITARQADGETFVPQRGLADIVLADASLHHVSQLERVVPAMRPWMVPGGRILLIEFVGPRRFQWTGAQLHHAQIELDAIPKRLRRLPDGRTLSRIDKPSLLRMRLVDPSEAVESDAIVPLMERHYRLEHRVELGGTLVDRVLGDIASNFTDPDDAEALAVVARVLAREQELIASGVLTSDQELLVYA